MDPPVTKAEREAEERPGNEAVRRETWPAASDQVIETINRVLGAVAERFDGLSLTNTKNGIVRVNWLEPPGEDPVASGDAQSIPLFQQLA